MLKFLLFIFFVSFGFFVNVYSELVLGLQLSAEAEAQGFLIWSSVVVVDGPAFTLPDSTLAAIAQMAYYQMAQDATARGIGARRMPAVVAVLAIQNTLIISSSIKGGPFMYGFDATQSTPAIQQALARCRMSLADIAADNGDVIHRNNGGCAEVMAVYIANLNPNTIPQYNAGYTKVVAFGRVSGGRFIVLDPCGSAGGANWGCGVYMNNLGIAVVPEGTQVGQIPNVNTLQVYHPAIC